MGIKDFFSNMFNKPEPRIILVGDDYSSLGDYDSTGLIEGEYNIPRWGMKKAKVPDWYNQHPYGEPRQDNITLFRQLAQMGFVSRVITKKLDKLFGTPWDIVPVEPLDDSPRTKAMIKLCKDFLMECNGNESHYFHELRLAYQDKLEIGEGVLVKAFNSAAYVDIGLQQKIVAREASAELKSIQAHDVSQFFIFQNNHKELLGHWQFNFVEKPPQFFSPRELIVFKDQPVTWRSYGRSRIGQITDMLEMVFYWSIHMKNHYKGGALLQGFIKTNGLSEGEQKDLEHFVLTKMRKMKHKVGIFHGGKDTDIKFEPMMLSVKDVAFLEGMDFFQRFVMSIYGIMPKDMGLPEVNRATGKEQTQDFEKQNKIEMNEIEFRTNMEIIRELDPEGLVEFKFIEEQDITVRATEQTIFDSRLTNSLMTINEVRRELGMESVAWGDVPMSVQAQQFQMAMVEKNQQAQLTGGPNGNGPKQIEAAKPESPALQEPKKKDDITKAADIDDKVNNIVDTITDAVRDARLEKLTGKLAISLDKKLQDEFVRIFDRVVEHVKKLSGTTRQVGMRARHSIGLDQVKQIVINAINLDELTKTLADEMLASYEIGLQLNDDMVIDANIFNLPDRRALDYLREYPLIVAKRVSDRIHNELSDIIYSGVNTGDSIPNITRKIKESMADYKTYQAERIARTEITNAVSWGKINQLRANGRERWQFYATEDERTCPICSERHEKLYDIDDLVMKPPAHPNCRCTILSGVGMGGYENNSAIQITKSIPTRKQAEIELTRNNSLMYIIKQIYRMNDNNTSVRDVAADLGVSHQTAANWIKEQTIKQIYMDSNNPNQAITKFNGNHDDKGRFTGSGSTDESLSEKEKRKSGKTLRNVKPNSFQRILTNRGFTKVRQAGSHQIWRDKNGKNVTFSPHGNKPIGLKTLKSMIDQMGLSEKEFLDLL